MVKIYYDEKVHSGRRPFKLWTVRKLENRKQRRNSFLNINQNYIRFKEYPYADCGGMESNFLWDINCLKRCDCCRAQ